MNGALRTSALVACIGNELVADDAVGFEVYKLLRTMDLPQDIRLVYTGVGGLSLLDLLSGDEQILVVVDAVQFGQPAGTVHCLSWDSIPFFGGSSISVHDIGLKETVDIGRELYPERIPPSVVLVGVEGRCFNRMRDAMTPETEAAVGTAVRCVLHEIENAFQQARYADRQEGLQ